MFLDPADEDRLCTILRAYVEEWGPEYVQIFVPCSWKDQMPARHFGLVPILYATENSIAIEVNYGDTRLRHETFLRHRPAA